MLVTRGGEKTPAFIRQTPRVIITAEHSNRLFEDVDGIELKHARVVLPAEYSVPLVGPV